MTNSIQNATRQQSPPTIQAQEELFIEILRKYPACWDPLSPHYKIKQTKVNAWNEIAHQSGYTVENGKKLLKRLKDTYTKCLGKIRQKQVSGAATQTVHKCKHFDLLGFLTDNASSQPADDNLDHPMMYAASQPVSSQYPASQPRVKVAKVAKVAPPLTV